ncbi:LysR family transcriptional regulator [Celeribacter sp.]|uniref:LysR family transcriptional regulator n=1 Tax=Celeribacter sp. TaxID=1890673 RepID=UPI003A9364DD
MDWTAFMRNFNSSHFDLNLIKVFLAVWDMQSLTDAAERLGLTQPAVSHSLRRLRDQFSDPLFQRVGNQMLPTATATRLRGPFEAALSLLEQTVQDTHHFVPETTSRRFRIAMTDTGEFFSMPRILAALEKAAPEANITSVRIDPSEIASALRSGHVDLAIGYLPGLDTAQCHGDLLLNDHLVCLMRENHPALTQDWSEESFACLSFVDVSHAATGYQMAQDSFKRRGLHINTKARLDHFTVVPEVVRQTDFVAIFPHSIFLRLEGRGGFAARDLPFELPSYDIKLWVHSSFSEDPALLWLRALIQTALTSPEIIPHDH